ncbi:acyltransferase family protein [Aphanothece sacrum]|nr:acyltransferase family protein [Aphanothece sacrum]
MIKSNDQSLLKLSRIIEFDALRVMALFMILYTHFFAYVPLNLYLNVIFNNTALIGLSIFVFLSGFGLYTSVLSKGLTNFNPLDFLKKRLLRIYPLYLLSIILYFLIFNFLKIYQPFDLQPIVRAIIGHLLCLQVIFYPKIPQMMTIWFIGMIVPFYLLFLITAALPIRKFIIANLFIFLLLVFIKFIFEINDIELIDLRLIFYYPIFVFGSIVAGFAEFFNRKQIYLKPAILLNLLLITIFSLFLQTQDQLTFPHSLHLKLIDVINVIYFFIHSFLFTTLLTLGVFLISQWIKQQKSLVVYLSNLSYAAYLLHRVVYGLFFFVINRQLNLPHLVRIPLFLLITILLFWISDKVVLLEKLLLKRVFPKIG